MTKLRALALTLIIASVGFSSCKKTPSSIGDNLQPTNTYIKVFSTQNRDIVAQTQRVDSILTSTSTTLLVGTMYDQVFGRTNIETYVQFSPSVTGQEWGVDAVADSIVLQLSCDGYYGDTTSLQKFTVMELDEGFNDSTDYYSNMTLATKDLILAEHEFYPHPTTFSNIDDDSLSKAVLRIKLDNSLGQSFIENEDKFVSNDDFIGFFKGLKISCDDMPGKGCINFYDATNSYTYVRLYYHNATDTLTYDITVSSSNYHFGHFSHDYESAVAPINFNDSLDSRYLYVQGCAGIMTWMKFPNIASWAKSLNTNIIVNEAKLVMTGAPCTIDGAINDTAVFTPPVQLIIAAKNSDGSSSILADQYVGSGYYGGQYKENGTVSFRLNQYVQDLIQSGPDAENLGLLLYVNAGSYTPRQWAFNGPQFADTTRSIRLQITYSTLTTDQ